MNKIANRAVMCEVLMERAAKDRDVVVLCSDSRGSASLAPYAERFPEQFVEVGIAEQDLVGIAAGLAACGKKAYAVSPASFISARSYEQVKVDCAYSNTNVKLVGISGGISYGALGMTHHSAQDIAGMSAIPNMRVYLPSDRHQTRVLFEALLDDAKPAYIRLGRNPVEDVYEEGQLEAFKLDRAIKLREGGDASIIACGETVRPALDAAALLAAEGINCAVIDMYCVKPLDSEAVLAEARATGHIVTVEEHSPFGGLGAAVSQVVSANHPCYVTNLSLPDEALIAGSSRELFAHYGLDTAGIAAAVRRSVAPRAGEK